MLEIDDLLFRYPGQAPDTPGWHFNVGIREGECVALTGPSGCGKSTLLNLVAGFLAPAGGDMRWQGQNLGPLPPWQRPVTTVFQEQNLFDHLTVAENVGLGLHPGLRLSKTQWSRIEAALETVNLGGLHNQRAGNLSGGQRQRVAVVRALLRPQPVLLLDEPMTGLDDENRTILQDLLLQARDQGKTLALVSHDIRDRQALADREVSDFFQPW
ncbi:ATP-binding cassette domain-containing protein [Marinobacter bryozoorum]|uniref:thiamine ABC transporter ATP-binding protein n=1 Tax=Marinobacter bryozoorum TaxID=256324 RepID=UPI0020065D39|nr:ATP-binding cassette domain-containing protein [Marinobacter bryozoorum]MCK7545760.1 ATP-binding cassette domain-containing protein [Marinobacter bryozoorum]